MMNRVDLEASKINGKHSYFLDYYNMIFHRGWIAGHEIKVTLKKLYDDLQIYDYKMKESHLRIEFAQTFCKQSKNRFYGKTIQYMKWQKALIEIIYSFYHPGTKRRRFNEVIIMIGRKNGKSTFVAADCNTDLFIGDGGQDICCSSNDDAQADLVFQEIDSMREMLDPIGRYTKRNRKGLKNIKNRSTIFKISDRTRNKEGRNITKAVIDEVHEMKDNTIFMSISQSSSIAQNPLIYEITTEGIVDGGYLDKRLSYARSVLNQEIDDESLLVWLYTQDSIEEIWTDPNSWWKSNPSIGEIKQWDYLEKNIEKAKISREDRAFILCKDFNIKQNKAISWLLEDEMSNTDSFSLEQFRGAFYIAGIDLSETTDLTAVSFMFIKKGISFFHTMYFIPESKARGENNTNLEKKNYFDWMQQKLVIILPGNEVNYDSITEYMWSLYENYRLKPFKIGYDNWNAKGLVQDLENKFGEGITERVRMDFNTLSNPMRALGADLKDGNVNYQNNEMTRWCLKNVAVKTNNTGQIMPVKVQGSGMRIDGAVTMMICYNIKTNYRTEFDALGGE